MTSFGSIAKVLIFSAFLLSTGIPRAEASPLAPRATLLISLDTNQEEARPLSGWLYRNYSDKISRKFRNVLDHSGLELAIIDRADLHDLAREIKNPENVALFWLSHASDPRKILSGGRGAVDPVILDAHGSDVKRLFAGAHPNLRWLSVIACSSALTLDETGQVIDSEQPLELEREESRELADIAPGIPPLLVQRFAVKKGAIHAMGQAAREARRYFKYLPEVRAGYQLQICAAPDAPAPSLEVLRQGGSELEHPPLAVLWEKTLIGTLPGLESKSPAQSQKIRLSLAAFRKFLQKAAENGGGAPLEISTLFTGARKYARDFEVGDIKMTLHLPLPVPYREDLEITLARVNKSDGSALGTVTQLFELKLDTQERLKLLDALELIPAQDASHPCPAIAPFQE